MIQEATVGSGQSRIHKNTEKTEMRRESGEKNRIE